jgi:hypothetical protein
MNERKINRPISVWLAYSEGATETLSGVLSYSSATEGVRFHSYAELMGLLRRLATASAGVGTEASPSTLRLAS